MRDTLPLDRVVRVDTGFLRSVHLTRDSAAGTLGRYYLTECGCRALAQMVSALDRPGDRAMTLIGPYGAGKSAFCLHASRLLAGHAAPELLADLESVSPELHRTVLASDRRLVPVRLVGARQPLAPSLVTGLLASLEENGYKEILSALSADQEMEEVLTEPSPSPRRVANLYQRSAELARLAGVSGVLLVIDELGKFLEHAALHPKEGDIFVLQELAEAAARSGDSPLLVLCVLHQNAAAYAHRIGRTYQMEWAKIGERFHEISFHPDDIEQISLVGRALRQTPELPLDGHLEALCREWVRMDLPHHGLAGRLSAVARSAYPLHPLTLLALPALFSRAGQSHRSVFNFLSGEEPHALGRFLREATFDPKSPPLFMLDTLYDYAAEVLLGGWSASTVTRLWADAVDCVERAVNLSAGARRVLKCIALLGIIRAPRLPATRDVLRLALTGSGGPEVDLAAALEELKSRRLVVESQVRRTFRLFEGGDIDVEAELASARSSLPAGASLRVARAPDLCPPPRLIARRHSFETGTLRSIRHCVCAAAELDATIEGAGHELALVLCLASTPEDAERAEERLRAIPPDQANLLAVVALETEALRDAAADIEAAHQVAKNTAGMQGDRAARRELAARRAEAEVAFRAEWDRLFGPQQGLATFFYRGREERRIHSARSLSEFLSTMADETYPHAPRLRNELVNRHSLSSAAAAGRRNLIQAMLTHPGEETLGIQGFPPERSIYECVLRATGIHRPRASGGWEFVPPSEDARGRLRPAWNALADLVFVEPPEPRAVPELASRLAAPPFGVTAGVFPVLLCAFFLAHGYEVTLYREGTFLPEPGVADFEVLMRRPELFAVAGCRVVGARAAVARRLARGLQTAPAAVPVVRALYRMVKGLPDHAWRTRRLPREVLAVREVLSQARSPERLLFHDLPSALGIPALDANTDDAGVERFFRALNGALGEWEQVTPAAVSKARDELLEACGLPQGDEGWASLREQARVLAPKATDARLKPFLNRASDTGEEQAVLESVLALLADKPPRAWTDLDTDHCIAQARMMGMLFRQALNSDASVATETLTPAEREDLHRIQRELRVHLRAGMSRRVLQAALAALIAEADAMDGGASDD